MSTKAEREYWESGCLCILTGRIKTISASCSHRFANNYYESNCRCTRHWDNSRVDRALDAEMRAKYKLKSK